MTELPNMISTTLEAAFSDVSAGYKTFIAILVAMLIYSLRFILSETGIGLIKSTVRTRNKEIDKNLDLISKTHIDSKSKTALRNRTGYLIRKGIIDVADEKLQECLIHESKHKNIDLKALKGIDSYLKVDIISGKYKLRKTLVVLDSIFMFLLGIGISAYLMGIIYMTILKKIPFGLSTVVLLMIFISTFIGFLYLCQKATYKIKISNQLNGKAPKP